MTKRTMEKRYKFNMQKYGHNIDYVYNICRNIIDDNEHKATDEQWDEFNEVCDVYSTLISNSDGLYAYVTYDIWKKAMGFSVLAEEYRTRANLKHSK